MAYDGTLSSGISHSSALHAGQPNCQHCPSFSLCLIQGLAPNDVNQWNSVVQSQLSLALPGQVLFEAGEAMAALYVVRAGCVKSVTIDEEGIERVRGFHLRGDLIGLDALDASHYPSTAVVVQGAQLCRIPRALVMQKLLHSPALMQRLLSRISANLGAALSQAGDYTAEQRMAAFMLDMQRRLQPLPGAPLKLPMNRRDIANYLRLATETVCRVLTRFAARGLIAADDRKLRLLNTAALAALAEPAGMYRPMAKAA